MKPRARLILGDATRSLREEIATGAIDMVYADPPFGNEQVWTGGAGSFSDRWDWSEDASRGWMSLRSHAPAGAAVLDACGLSRPALAYIGVMAGIMIECHRALKPTGSLWLHHDDVSGAHLRILGDAIFGPDNALGTVIWKRADHHLAKNRFGRVHDTIAVWARTRVARWRLWRTRDRELVCGDPIGEGICVQGILDDRLNAASSERVGYPTQKPVALIERFIRAATLPGDTVLDPTCGSGTTLVAALNLGRQAVGIDRSEDAITAARARTQPPAPKAGAQLDLFGSAA